MSYYVLSKNGNWRKEVKNLSKKDKYMIDSYYYQSNWSGDIENVNGKYKVTKNTDFTKRTHKHRFTTKKAAENEVKRWLEKHAARRKNK